MLQTNWTCASLAIGCLHCTDSFFSSFRPHCMHILYHDSFQIVTPLIIQNTMVKYSIKSDLLQHNWYTLGFVGLVSLVHGAPALRTMTTANGAFLLSNNWSSSFTVSRCL